MKAWTHENGTLAYPQDENDEAVLREYGWYPVEVLENTITAEQIVTEIAPKRRGRPRLDGQR